MLPTAPSSNCSPTVSERPPMTAMTSPAAHSHRRHRECRGVAKRTSRWSTKQVARFLRKLPPNVLRDDLVAAGMIGLIDSLRKHGKRARPRPSSGTPAFASAAPSSTSFAPRIGFPAVLGRTASPRIEERDRRDKRTRKAHLSRHGTFVRLDDLRAYESNLDFADYDSRCVPCEQISEAHQGEHARPARRVPSMSFLPARARFVITVALPRWRANEGHRESSSASASHASRSSMPARCEKLRSALLDFAMQRRRNSVANPNDRPTIPVPGRARCAKRLDS